MPYKFILFASLLPSAFLPCAVRAAGEAPLPACFVHLRSALAGPGLPLAPEKDPGPPGVKALAAQFVARHVTRPDGQRENELAPVSDEQIKRESTDGPDAKESVLGQVSNWLENVRGRSLHARAVNVEVKFQTDAEGKWLAEAPAELRTGSYSLPAARPGAEAQASFSALPFSYDFNVPLLTPEGKVEDAPVQLECRGP